MAAAAVGDVMARVNNGRCSGGRHAPWQEEVGESNEDEKPKIFSVLCASSASRTKLPRRRTDLHSNMSHVSLSLFILPNDYSLARCTLVCMSQTISNSKYNLLTNNTNMTET